MRRIHTQRETFALRLAADSVDVPGKKKKDEYGLDIPDVDKERNLHATPEGFSAKGFNDAAEAAESGAGAIGQMQKSAPIPGVSGGSAGSNSSGGGYSGGGGGGTPDASGILPNARPLFDTLMQKHPGADIGGYRVDNYHEHDSGALDFMTSDPNQASSVMQDAFAAGAPYVLWQQQQWNADGSRSPMENRGNPTQNHFDHVHIAPIGR